MKPLTPSNAPRVAEGVYADAHAVLEHLVASLVNLEQSKAGYPASTPGARPPESGGPTVDLADPNDDAGSFVQLTRTEAGALRPDHYAHDEAVLLSELAAIAPRLRIVRTLVERHAIVVAPAVAPEGQDSIWCRTCATVGHHVGREEGRQTCRWCRQWIESHNGTSPPEQLLVVRRERGVVTDRDIAQWKKSTVVPTPSKSQRPTTVRRKGSTSALLRRDLDQLARGTEAESAADMAARFATERPAE